jgi:hypothetical protein
MGTVRQRCGPGVDEKGPDRRSAHDTDFDAAWQRYCDVIRDLELTAAELEALRNCRE